MVTCSSCREEVSITAPAAATATAATETVEAAAPAAAGYNPLAARAPSPPRRTTAIFTAERLTRMREVFAESAWPSKPQIDALAKELDRTVPQVYRWFVKERMRAKSARLAAAAEEEQSAPWTASTPATSAAGVAAAAAAAARRMGAQRELATGGLLKMAFPPKWMGASLPAPEKTPDPVVTATAAMALAAVSDGGTGAPAAAPAPAPAPARPPRGYHFMAPDFQQTYKAFASEARPSVLSTLSRFHDKRLADGAGGLRDLDDAALNRLLTRLNGGDVAYPTYALGEVMREFRTKQRSASSVMDWLERKVDAADLEELVQSVMRERPSRSSDAASSEADADAEADAEAEADDASTSGGTQLASSPDQGSGAEATAAASAPAASGARARRGRPRRRAPARSRACTGPLRTRRALNAALRNEGLGGWVVRVRVGEGPQRSRRKVVRYKYVRETRATDGGRPTYQVAIRLPGIRSEIRTGEVFSTMFDAALAVARRYFDLCNGDPERRPGESDSDSDSESDDEPGVGGGGGGDDDDDGDDDDGGGGGGGDEEEEEEEAAAAAAAPSAPLKMLPRKEHVRATVEQEQRMNGRMAWLARVAEMAARYEAQEEAEEAAEAAEAAKAAGAKDASQEKDADGECVVLEGKEVVRCDMQYCQRPVNSAPRICNIHTVCFVCIQMAMTNAAVHQRAKAKCPGCTRLFNTRDVRMHMREQGGPSGAQ